MRHARRRSPRTCPPATCLDTPQAGPAAIRGSLLRFGGYGVGVLLSVVSISFLIRHLGVSSFGQYVTVISLVTIVQGVTDAGLTTIGVREYSLRSAEARDSLMRSLLGVRLVLTSTGVLLATGFAAVAGYGGALVLGTLLAGTGLLFTVTQATLAVPLASRLQLGWVTGLDLLRQLLLVRRRAGADRGRRGAGPVPRAPGAARGGDAACDGGPRPGQGPDAAGLRPAGMVAPGSSGAALRRRRGDRDHLPAAHGHCHVADLDRARNRVLRDRVPRGGGDRGGSAARGGCNAARARACRARRRAPASVRPVSGCSTPP